VLKCPRVCLEIRAFLTHLLEGQLCPISYTFLARQTISAILVISQLNKGKR